MARSQADVHVTRGEDGTIRVAAAALDSGAAAAFYGDVGAVGPEFTWAVLDVAGAALTWPVLGAPGPPSAEIHDEGRAQQWLWALYGERVAAAVHDFHAVHDSAAGESAAGVRVAADLTALAGSAARLGLGHWASRWWPASYPDGIPALEPDLHGLELAALTHRCQQLFDEGGGAGEGDGDGDGGGDQPDDCAAELIEEHLAALDPLVQWWRATAQPPHTARHLENVLRLIDAAADNAGLDAPALRRLRSSLERAQGLDLGRPVGPGALFARHDGYALAAGEPIAAGGRVIARGTGTNDWRRYPPGFVDAAEDAVSWTARALGARRRIEVEAVAHIAAPAAGAPLVAEFRVNGGHQNRVPLARRDDVWTGRADLDLDLGPGLDLSGIEVGVVLPGFDPGRDGGEGGEGGEDGEDGQGGADEGRVARAAVRAMVRRRLTVAAEPQAYDASPHDASLGPFLAETAAATMDEDY
ncbi:hypothetical protein SAMN04487983_101198 [Streptomyces sp. yr375]|uniref:hypothetical protein n=1 Tax=Streptomyces sp. yr375 TaxID=1761906 RepID=UPI0008C5AA27|nr:hypothetical protein [Streptomyces sp. yr375]SER11563.1 hypothetical protein SAMN04487983_101198 [Streptomyces sp. yr375]